MIDPARKQDSKRQFSLRTVLVLVTLFAVGFAVYSNLLQRTLRIRLQSSGEILVNGVTTPEDQITNRVKKAIAFRDYCFDDSFAVISVPPGKTNWEKLMDEDWFDLVMESGVNTFEVVEEDDY